MTPFKKNKIFSVHISTMIQRPWLNEVFLLVIFYNYRIVLRFTCHTLRNDVMKVVEFDLRLFVTVVSLPTKVWQSPTHLHDCMIHTALTAVISPNRRPRGHVYHLVDRFIFYFLRLFLQVLIRVLNVFNWICMDSWVEFFMQLCINTIFLWSGWIVTYCNYWTVPLHA